MTIQAKLIRKPRKRHACASCHVAIAKGEPHLRLYGSARRGDPPYSVRMCLDCAKNSKDPKIREATNSLLPPAEMTGKPLDRAGR